MTNTQPTILIGLPLYQGWEHVEQTLESIQRQTYKNFRVLISVDGNDKRSYDACSSFMNDERFERVLQEEHLHWHGNITWLGEQLREDFFCYWQHDDHCEAEYLEALVDHAVENPQAASIYCEMRLYGEIENITRVPSQTGFALERVMFHVLTPPQPAAIRCLIRADAMRASLPITVVHVWMMTVARLGELHCVPRVLYHRRIRPNSLTFTLPQRSEAVLKRDAIDWAVGVVKNVHPLINVRETAKLFSMVVDLSINKTPRNKYQYDFRKRPREEKLRFVCDFLREAEDHLGVNLSGEYRLMVSKDRSSNLSEVGCRRSLLPGEDLLIEAIRTTSGGDSA